MRVGIAADHAGFELKQIVAAALPGDLDLRDFGAEQFDAQDDYPDIVVPLAQALADGQIERGIVLCGSGVGASIVANKFSGVRAAVCHDGYSAHQGVEHDDMNILCLGGRIIGPALATELVHIFLAARFSGEERHVRRLTKIRAIESAQIQR